MKFIIASICMFNLISAEERFYCQIERVFNSISLQVFSGVGLNEVDTLIVIINNKSLSYKIQNNSIKYINIYNGTWRLDTGNGFNNVQVSIYDDKNNIFRKIYSYYDFQKMVIVNGSDTSVYRCKEF